MSDWQGDDELASRRVSRGGAGSEPTTTTDPGPGGPDQAPDLGTLSQVPTDELEARVCTLAGHLASATCQWLLLLGELDARNGWAGPGLRSCADWLSWRCGLSLTAARQHVRVAAERRAGPVDRMVLGRRRQPGRAGQARA